MKKECVGFILKYVLRKMFCLGKEPSHNSLQKGKAPYTCNKLLAASLRQPNLPPNPAGVLLGQMWVRSSGEQAVPITLQHMYSMGALELFRIAVPCALVKKQTDVQ